MRYIFLIILTLLCFSCRNSQKQSFNDLSDAFLNWYSKSHPVEASMVGIQEFDGLYRNYSDSEISEYIADLNRFKIELSQIDETKLKSVDFLEYKVLEHGLHLLSFKWNKVQPTIWNPNLIISNIYDGLLVITDREQCEMTHRVKSIISRLEKLPTLIEIQQNNLQYSSQFHIDLAIENIQNILNLFEQLPLLIYAEHNLLDKVDSLIIQNSNVLLSHKNWLNKTVVNFPQSEQLQNSQLYREYFTMHFMGIYELDETIEFAKQNIYVLQNSMFKNALPHYLKTNDEPIWIDRDDSLKVIQWTLDSIFENHPSHGSILSEIYASINRTNSYLKNANYSFSQSIKIDVDLKESYHSSYPLLDLRLYSKNKNPKLLVSVDEIKKTNLLLYFNPYLLDLKIFGEFFPGKWYLESQKTSSDLVSLFPSSTTLSGWQAFCEGILVNELHTESNLKVVQLRQKLIDQMMFVLEYEYFVSNISLSERVNWVKTTGFMSDVDAEKLVGKIKHNNFANSFKYVSGVEFDRLYNALAVKRENYSPNKFMNELLKLGPVPIFELETQLLSR